MSLGIYRTTQADDQRVLEDGVSLRVTENYIEAESSLSASGVVSVVGSLNLPAASSVSASSTLAASAFVSRYAVALVANNSAIQAVPTRTTRGSASVVATGSMAAVPTFKGSAIAGLVATGTATVDSRTAKFVSVVSGSVEFERITEEDEDSRITEDGNQRITNLVAYNSIDSTMVAEATLIPFSSVAYIKRNGEWKQLLSVDIKDDGTWSPPEKIYRNMSGSWKRIY
jgi:hypothetical protein